MTLEDTLKWVEEFGMEGRWPDNYSRVRKDHDPNWGWLDLWTQENPTPENTEDFADWWEINKALRDRIWVAYCLPQFNVFDWSDKDVENARKLVSGHVCGVCGRIEDSGCSIGC